ncbi:MAG: ATP-binding protein, partial [Oscillospiraceae bacterium]|nr:ATP-binding protein [Oscillospiraceae bacterium]
EEERRLCYVGITRAKERLYLSSAETRTLYGNTDYTRESQFMREIDSSLLVGDAVFKKKGASLSGGAGFLSQEGNSVNRRDGYGKPVGINPFEALKQSRDAAEARRKTSGEALKQGDRVSHAKFGEGLVLEAEGKVVTVMFDEFGTKKLAADLAPIKKI